MKLVALSIPVNIKDLTPQDIGAMATLLAGYLEHMAGELASQGASQDVIRIMQTLTMQFMQMSGRSAIMDNLTPEMKKWYEEQEAMLLTVVNTPNHELSIIDKDEDEPDDVILKH